MTKFFHSHSGGLLLMVLPLLSPGFSYASSSCFEPFTNAAAAGGTRYEPGTALCDQVNAAGGRWAEVTTSPARAGIPVIAPVSLAYPGWPSAPANGVVIPPRTGVMGRMTLPAPITNGTAFFSFLLKVTDIAALDETGQPENFFAAFGDNVGSQSVPLLRAASRVYARRSGTNFLLGVARNSNKPADRVFDLKPRQTGEVLLIIGAYDFSAKTSSLWINPPAQSFGGAPPAPDLTATRGNGLNGDGVRSFALGCGKAAPLGCEVADLRIGNSWAFITGHPEAEILTHLQILETGQTAVLTARLSGAEARTVKWLKNGKALAGTARISGENSATLTIRNMLGEDDGAYSARITTASGEIETPPAQLQVNDPLITVNPVNQVCAEGQTVVFQVVATGTGTLGYQWQKNGEPLQDGPEISGATTRVLTVKHVTAVAAGSYSAFVTNALGSVSQPAQLYVTPHSVAGGRPNIIFILCDDLGYGDVGVLFQNGRREGLPRERTPNMDAFAAGGIQLRQHYCPAPVCAPSRASLMLGVHQGHANVRDQQFDKALENNHTLATVLKTAGYATAAIGKWGLQGTGGASVAQWPGFPTKRGFDYYFGYVRHGDGHDHYPKEAPYSNHGKECYDGEKNISPDLDKCYTADLFTARAKKWITDQHTTKPGQPFFLYLAFDTPHSVYELPTQAYPAGGGLRGGLQWLGEPGHMINTASGKIDSYMCPEYAAATYDHNGRREHWPEAFQRFASSVRRIDDALGDLTQLLRDLDLETNTLVVFTSDNGPTIEDALQLSVHYAANFFDNYGPLDGIKRDTWEGGIRMPTFVRWPGKIKAGTISQNPSQFHDWMPTFAELAGLPAPARTDGVSLVPTLTGSGPQPPSTVYVEFLAANENTPDYAAFLPGHRRRVRKQMQVIGLEGYQGVRYNIASPADDFEIYDVTHDLKEGTNLALLPSFAPLQQRMKDRVLQLRRPSADAGRPYDNALVPASKVAPGMPGRLNAAVFEGVWPWLPDTAMLAPILTNQAAGLDLGVSRRETNFAIEFTGLLTIPADGDYTFYLESDSGALLRLHEATVIDDDFSHRTGGEVSGSIRLQAGLHPLRLTYRHSTGGRKLVLQYSGAGISKQPVPAAVFSAP